VLVWSRCGLALLSVRARRVPAEHLDPGRRSVVAFYVAGEWRGSYPGVRPPAGPGIDEEPDDEAKYPSEALTCVLLHLLLGL
jgi:hypothetical protein